METALELRLRTNKVGGLSPELSYLDGIALRLVIERPAGWEYLLFSSVLQTELNRLKNLRRDWEHGIALGSGSQLRPLELIGLIDQKLAEAGRMASSLDQLLNKALALAFGPLRVSGIPEEIVYVADRLAQIYRDALEWKLSFNRLGVPKGWKDFVRSQAVSATTWS